MNNPAYQSSYLGNTYRPPQPLVYPFAPYPQPVQNVYVQQQHHNSGDGLFGILLAIGLFFTWVDTRHQKTEVHRLNDRVARLERNALVQGVHMDQTSESALPLAAAQPPPATSTSFGDGTHFVGENGVLPGIYQVVEPGIHYYAARLRNFSGQNAILANWSGVTPGIIEILPTDAGVESRGGVTWQRVSQ